MRITPGFGLAFADFALITRFLLGLVNFGRNTLKVVVRLLENTSERSTTFAAGHKLEVLYNHGIFFSWICRGLKLREGDGDAVDRNGWTV